MALLVLNSEDQQCLVSKKVKTFDEHEIDSGSIGSLLYPSGQAPLYHSTGATIALYIKSYIGAGILALPFAMKQVGIVPGTILLVVVALVCYLGIKLLLDCRDKMMLLSVSSKYGYNSYPDIAAYAFGKSGLIACWIFICLCQLGCCIAYLVFITNNIRMILYHSQVIDVHVTHWYTSYQSFLVYLLPLVLFVSLCSDLKHLFWPAIIGTLLHVTAMGMILIYGGSENGITMTTDGSIVASTAFTSIPLFLGVATFAMEGINLAIPFASQLNPKSSLSFNFITMISLVIITVVYLLFAILGFAIFGDSTCSVITSSLQKGNLIFIDCVSMMLCCVLFLSYPLQLLPVCKLLEKNMLTKISSKMKKIMIPMGLSLCVTGMAMATDDFATVLSVMGGVTFNTMGFIFPALIHCKLFWSEASTFEKLQNICMIVWGSGILIMVLYSTMVQRPQMC